MLAYALRRMLQALPLGLGVTFITFLLVSLAPGDVLTELRFNENISPETLEAMRRDLGLDQGLLIQYVSWLEGLFRLDFGESMTYRTPVLSLVLSRAGATIMLSFCAMVVSWAAGVGLGMLAAGRPGSWTDRVSSVGAFMGISVPNFFLALLLLYLASMTGWFPTGGLTSAHYENLSPWGKALDLAWHLVIPTLVLATAGMASLFRITRSHVGRALSEPHILAARARGLSQARILWKHGLRAGLNPLITLFGYELSGLLSGAALTEIVCSYPGLGRLVLEAVLAQDIYLVAGATLAGFILLMAGNFFADLLLVWNDPRLRLGRVQT